MPGKRRTTFFVSVAGLAIVAALTVQGNLAGAGVQGGPGLGNT